MLPCLLPISLLPLPLGMHTYFCSFFGSRKAFLGLGSSGAAGGTNSKPPPKEARRACSLPALCAPRAWAWSRKRKGKEVRLFLQLVFSLFLLIFGSKLQAGTSIGKGAGLSDGLCVQAVHLPSSRKVLLAPAERERRTEIMYAGRGDTHNGREARLFLQLVFLRDGGTSICFSAHFRKQIACSCAPTCHKKLKQRDNASR
jgi:hypothetical protein